MTIQKHIQRLSGVYDMPYLLFVLAAVFWSGNFVLARAMHAEIPPVALAFWRWAGASVVVTVFARAHLSRDRAELCRRWPIVLLLSLLGIATMNTLLYAGLQFTTVVNAALLMALMPAFVMLLALVGFGERLHPAYSGGILLSFVGAFLVVTEGRFQVLLPSRVNQGDLLVLLAAAVFAAYSVAMRLRPAVHPLSLMSVTFSLGALILLPFWWWEIAAGHSMVISTPTLLTLLYQMIFPSVIAYFCFNRCIETIGAVRAGFCIHLVPLFSSLIGIFLLGELFVWYHAVGTFLIVCGILFTTPLATLIFARPLSIVIPLLLNIPAISTKGN